MSRCRRGGSGVELELAVRPKDELLDDVNEEEEDDDEDKHPQHLYLPAIHYVLLLTEYFRAEEKETM